MDIQPEFRQTIQKDVFHQEFDNNKKPQTPFAEVYQSKKPLVVLNNKKQYRHYHSSTGTDSSNGSENSGNDDHRYQFNIRYIPPLVNNNNNCLQLNPSYSRSEFRDNNERVTYTPPFDNKNSQNQLMCNLSGNCPEVDYPSSHNNHINHSLVNWGNIAKRISRAQTEEQLSPNLQRNSSDDNNSIHQQPLLKKTKKKSQKKKNTQKKQKRVSLRGELVLERKKRFALSFVRAFENNPKVQDIVKEQAHLPEIEVFRLICKKAQINWLDGTKDRRGKLLHLFGKRIVEAVHEGHKGCNLRID